MELTEFEALAEPFCREAAEQQARYGFNPIEGLTVTAAEIAAVERGMAVTLPDRYKAFLTRFGAGLFGFVELFPIVPVPGRYDDLRTVNDQEFPDRDFVVVAPVGTGDHWGFPVVAGRCQEQVWFHYHDVDDDELVAADFLEFLAEQGLKSCSDRALERRD
ncbi:hypothetical protein FHR83_002076 [Actinoplanes campanulatus]|uniref:SMI1-KNR4 cell-wall n=1 Tax=Actinoplanes campanulatus TaxID=113559 RepID=A0A7W5AER5_9ACTN|nr:SMI1/KNR4 family protein [Actinoplanes campanulatus]MBB3094424.1 hypothetical protein [Actinoplanes campanulatus]GGN20914.1 hypothetical protein GCM10010109_34870 [Actinoplanes campanulatus]GID35663.1 hypothetical protein Aca09nite_21690 [Actinoplanes campanulatus]